MHMKLSSLATALALAAAAPGAMAKGPSARDNEAATARHYAQLIAGEARLSELTLFMSQMPKGGDLHHHYSGAVYAEQFLEFVDQQGFCVNQKTYTIETDKAVVQAERAKAAGQRACLSRAEVLADDYTWRELLQRWSSKDFHNHGAVQPPPDRQFFQTFGYFLPVASGNYKEALATLKQRAIDENVGYIETIYNLAPLTFNGDFDAQVAKAADDAALAAVFDKWMAALEKDAAFNKGVGDYVSQVETSHAGIDDANFTMRYQAYVLRLLPPAPVFSSMLAAFKAASQSKLVVGVNIVGQESNYVAMRDYTLHMKMFKFLKQRYPKVKLALHAGELALGDVPPEGLKFHIQQALDVAGANRIGHGIDLAHESKALAIMQQMREKDIAVEINLTSNAFISGISGENHPLTLYRKYGVPYVISTDDAGVTRHNLANEYVLFASRYKPSYAEVKKASYNSVRYAFLPDADKKRLTTQLDARYAAFETAIAGLGAKAAK
jgi:adenosine deaminase